MKVRIEIDKPNGKAYETNIDDKFYDKFRELIIKIRVRELKKNDK